VSSFDSRYGIPGVGHAHHEEGEEHGEEEHEDEGEEVRIDLDRLRYDLQAEITEPFGPFQGLKFRLGVTDYEHAASKTRSVPSARSTPGR
jgi:iron complex outermembrane receptor protein